jgi:PmbA protein
MESPHLDYFLKSQNMDDEGIKTTEKDIIKEGIFKKPIYDLYSSLKYNKKATGNGFLSNNYSAGYTNIIQEAGSKSIEDVIDTTKKGILVYQILGLHTNKISDGNFALTISSGKEISNGKFTKTITNLNFSGNLKEILKEVYFSKEQKFFGSAVYSFTVITKVKLI